MKTRTPWILMATIVVIALTRLLPHPPNFSPVVAVALFGGAALADRKLAFIVPMAAMFIADLFIGFHNTMVFVYLAMALVVAFGLVLGKKSETWDIDWQCNTGVRYFFPGEQYRHVVAERYLSAQC